jgi:uncharacterized protein YndB with AHSA1/START domain
MSETKSIIVEYELPYPPSKVWHALTDSKLLASWLMPNDIAAVVGHKFNFHTKPQGGWDGTVYCEVLIVEPEKRLRYSWRGGDPGNKDYGHPLDTVVTWTLTPDGNGTKLLLEHEGFRDEDNFAYAVMGQGWREHLRASMSKALNSSG